MNKIALYALLAFMPLLMSCETDAYDKGEGEYSLMTAELVDAYVGSDKYVTRVVTDQGDEFTMEPHATAKWIEKADTTYRALLYFNKVGNDKAEAISLGWVGVLVPRDSIKGGMKTDPLFTESMWLGKNRRYLNMRLRLLTGTADDEKAQHSIGVVIDSTTTTPDVTGVHSSMRASLYTKSRTTKTVASSSSQTPNRWLISSPNALIRYIRGPLWSKASR